jgi:serine/threonine protein kinase
LAESHIHALPAGFEFEGYRIERMLGSGGFGITYQASETLIRRTVAIKEYLPSSVAARAADSAHVRPLGEEDAELFRWGLKRFRNEARTLVAFHHPNIVSVYRFFEANGTAYLVMAFEEGLSLAKILDKAVTLPEEEIREFLDPLLDGVAEVHKAGFLHRDIKPANIMIRRDGTPSLIDFGAARLALGSKTESASKAIVSPGFAPFEQYTSAAEQGPPTDIYALGATLYRCVTGERPPDAPDRVAGVSMPSAYNTGRGRYSDALLRAIDRALMIHAEDRPQSVAAWRVELEGAEAMAAPAPVSAEEPEEKAARSASRQAATVPPATAPVATASRASTARTRAHEPSSRRSQSRKRVLQFALLGAVALAGSAGAFQGIRWWLDYERRKEEQRRAEEERKERERRELEERKERERREAERRRPAEAAATKGRDAQRSARSAMQDALKARKEAFSAAECGRNAAERGRRKDSGYYSGKLTNQNTYEGAMNASNFPHGCGVLVNTKGTRFEGQFSNGHIHGHATAVGYDGARYEGGYRDGRIHGYGVLRFANGNEASGEFQEGEIAGFAVWVEVDGKRFEGQFVKGRWQGHGVLRLADGGVFEGEFVDGRIHGRGVLTAKDGTKTHGRWEKGEHKGLD